MLTEQIVVECYLGRKYHVIQCLNLIPHYKSVSQGRGRLGRCRTGSNEKKNNYIVTRFLIVHNSINLFNTCSKWISVLVYVKSKREWRFFFLTRNYILLGTWHRVFTWFLPPTVHVWRKITCGTNTKQAVLSCAGNLMPIQRWKFLLFTKNVKSIVLRYPWQAKY